MAKGENLKITRYVEEVVVGETDNEVLGRFTAKKSERKGIYTNVLVSITLQEKL